MAIAAGRLNAKAPCFTARQAAALEVQIKFNEREVGPILDRLGVFAVGHGNSPNRRQMADLLAALPKALTDAGAALNKTVTLETMTQKTKREHGGTAMRFNGVFEGL